MSFEEEGKLHRDELISFLKKFKHNEIDKWELIEESFEKYRERFFSECDRANKAMAESENQDAADEIARKFLATCAGIEAQIDKQDEFAFVFRDHTKWNSYVFYFPYKMTSALARRKLGIVDMETGKEYDIALTRLESAKIWSNVSAALQEFDKQRNHKVYKEFFRL
jgi:uncharacterized protein YjaZ